MTCYSTVILNMTEDTMTDHFTTDTAPSLDTLIRAIVADHVRQGIDDLKATLVPASHDELVWDVATVARLLGKSQARVRAMAQAGEIPAFKLDAHWSFSPQAVRDWLVERQRS